MIPCCLESGIQAAECGGSNASVHHRQRRSSARSGSSGPWPGCTRCAAPPNSALSGGRAPPAGGASGSIYSITALTVRHQLLLPPLLPPLTAPVCCRRCVLAGGAALPPSQRVREHAADHSGPPRRAGEAFLPPGTRSASAALGRPAGLRRPAAEEQTGSRWRRGL